MGTAGAVRAGRAFVELFVDDETVQESLNQVKAKLKTFGAAVDTVAAASFTRLQTSAVASTASSAAGVGILSASMGVLRASAIGVGNAFRVMFTAVSGSVAKAVVGIGAMAALVRQLAPNSRFAGLLNGFMDKSQTTEAIGRWTRFFGFLSGSNVMRDLGNRIERLGLGSAIVRGFSRGGVVGGIGATIGAGFRSARSVILGSIGSVIGAPFRGIGAVFGGGSSAASSAQLATDLTRASVAARALTATSAGLSAFGGIVRSVATRVGVLAAAISGPALLAARSFLSASAESFGGSSLVSEKDLAAAAELNDLMKQMKQAVAAAWAQIGIAALPVLREATEFTLRWANAIGQFLSQNREMATTIIRVSTRIVAMTGASYTLYRGLSAMIPIISLLFTPMGAAIAAVAVGIGVAAYMFPQLRKAASSTFEYLMGGFATLGETVNQMVEGIANALSGGSIQAAGKVLWSGLNLVWLQGTSDIRSIYTSFTTKVAELGINAFYGMLKAWQVVTSTMTDIWFATQNKIAQGIARMIAAFTGQDVNEVLASLKAMQNEDQAARVKGAKDRLDAIEKERAAALEANQEIDAEKRRAAQQELEDARKAFKEATDEAAAIAKNGNAGGAGALGATRGTQSLGTFNALGIAGRANVGSSGDLRTPLNAIVGNTKKLADNIGKNPFEWVA